MPRYTDKTIIEALEQTYGMIYLAADAIGCDPATILARIRKNEVLREKQLALREKTIDTAELKLYSAILDGQPWAIQFYLKTQGKHRGYSEHMEVTGPGGGSLQLQITIADAFGEIIEGSVVEPVKELPEGSSNGQHPQL